MNRTSSLSIGCAIVMSLALTGCIFGGPDIEVIVQRGERGASELVQGIPHVTIRSRDEKPVQVTSLLINDDEDCQSLMGLPMPSPFPVQLKLGQSVSVISACQPVKIVISTDRGAVKFNFR